MVAVSINNEEVVACLLLSLSIMMLNQCSTCYKTLGKAMIINNMCKVQTSVRFC